LGCGERRGIVLGRTVVDVIFIPWEEGRVYVAEKRETGGRIFY
jgi:hypothetical protein